MCFQSTSTQLLSNDVCPSYMDLCDPLMEEPIVKCLSLFCTFCKYSAKFIIFLLSFIFVLSGFNILFRAIGYLLIVLQLFFCIIAQQLCDYNKQVRNI
jgi:hypothetical protein